MNILGNSSQIVNMTKKQNKGINSFRYEYKK